MSEVAGGAAPGGAGRERAERDVAEPPVAEHHVEVPRTARYYTVGDRATARTVWLALHGYGQLAGYFARHFAPHAGAGSGRLVVVPEALSRFYVAREHATTGEPARVGATWMTREDRLSEIGDYVRYLDRTLDAATPGLDLAAVPLGILGFSQGAATAARWLAHRHRGGLAVPNAMVVWGGALPHDFDLAGADGDALRATRLTLVVGDRDEFATAAVVAEQERRLTEAGVAYALVRYAGGHRMDGAALGRVLAGSTERRRP